GDGEDLVLAQLPAHRPVPLDPAGQARIGGGEGVAGAGAELLQAQHMAVHVRGCRVRPIVPRAHRGSLAGMSTAAHEDTTAASPIARLAMVTLDAPETAPMARFWNGVLGWPIAV